MLSTAGFVALVLVTIALIGLLVLRPSMFAARGGRILGFLSLFLLPLLVTGLGTSAQIEHSKTTTFCLSCHVMAPYGRSLLVDHPSYVPARHYQNNRVPREAACFTCHTNYTMFGDYKAKLRGLRHVYVNYIGTIPKRIKLYEPYNNRECLHCHGGARNFEANDVHQPILAELAKNSTSCLECHDKIHNVHDMAGVKMWKETMP
ncbi:MAG TPA: NapC/NirT family cytochrome c [Thermoanaerobaculia bacterium]|jgi:cytochrome c-type protein NapC|nr:NapC/NirT family cytochrome c [Thermoanaerobaculia bacterium]